MDNQEQLRRILRPTGAQPAPAIRRSPGPSLDALVAGRWIENGGARVFLAEQRYPVEHRHGSRPLGALVEAARARWPDLLFGRPGPFDLSDALFLDTETTGLGRGPGTFCFMVGLGHLQGDTLAVRQYMAPDYGDEPLLLSLVDEEALQSSGIISFNGRTFDLPILETRYVLNGYRTSPLAQRPHLDLLLTARRLWGRSLPSCALGALEGSILGLLRSEEDVPGYLIPDIYREYVTTGAAENLARVFYHNLNDILSMVTLTVEAAEVLESRSNGGNSHGDPIALGRLHEAAASPTEAASAYRRGLRDRNPAQQREARERLSFLLKRQGQMHDAVSLWLDALDDGALYPYVELAKFYEHRARAYDQAALMVRRAMQAVARGEVTCPRQSEALEQLAHRLKRLERRLAVQTLDTRERGACT